MPDADPSPASDTEARAARWLTAWDEHDSHRTGTGGDAQGAAWLTREITALRGAQTIEAFTFDRLEPVTCYLDIDGTKIPGVPVFDAPTTDAHGVSGHLGAVGGAGEIAAAEVSPAAVYTGEFRELRRTARHRGLVVVCAGEAPGLALLNAEQFRTPYGAPAIQVASEDGPAVFAAAAKGMPARLVAESARLTTRAANTVVTVRGRDPKRAPLVVLTPRSSWWQSTAERGGGLVCWLEALRAVVMAAPRRQVVFAATTGHELGHLGLDHFLARRPGWDKPAGKGGAIWVHFGANLGAAGGRLTVMSTTDALRTLAADQLEKAGHSAVHTAEKTVVPSGETRDIHRAGGTYLTLVGSNRLFHLPQDRWPDAVDLPAVARIAAAGARIVAALAA